MRSSLVLDLAPRSNFWVYLTHIHRRHHAFPSNVVLKDRRAHRTNERRLRAPEPVPPYEGLYNVQEFGKACPQQFLKLPNGLDSRLVGEVNQVVDRMSVKQTPTDEDCKGHAIIPSRRELNVSQGLTINVVTPADAISESGLPVVVVGTSLSQVVMMIHLDNCPVDSRWWLPNWWILRVCLFLLRSSLVLVTGSSDTMAVHLSLDLLILASPSFSLA
jgi:hypothetical protein